MEPESNVSDLVRRARSGDSGAADVLLSETYDELRKLARARLRSGGRSVFLDTASLINEWYLRFVTSKGATLQDRVHFMRHAARVMRSVIVDFARQRDADRRGGGTPHVELTIQLEAGQRTGEQEIVKVNEALDELTTLDARMAQIVEMRFFAGLGQQEIAEALDLSERTVRREWEKARLWLSDALS